MCPPVHICACNSSCIMGNVQESWGGHVFSQTWTGPYHSRLATGAWDVAIGPLPVGPVLSFFLNFLVSRTLHFELNQNIFFGTASSSLPPCILSTSPLHSPAAPLPPHLTTSSSPPPPRLSIAFSLYPSYISTSSLTPDRHLFSSLVLSFLSPLLFCLHWLKKKLKKNPTLPTFPLPPDSRPSPHFLSTSPFGLFLPHRLKKKF